MTSRPWDSAAAQTLRQAEALLAAPVLRWLEGATRPWVADPWTRFEGLLRASLVVDHPTAPRAPGQQRDPPHDWAWTAARPASAASPASPGADKVQLAAKPLEAAVVSLPGARAMPGLSVQRGRAPAPPGDALSGDARSAAKPGLQDARVDVARASPRPPPSAALSSVPTRAQRMANAARVGTPAPAVQASGPSRDRARARPASARILAWPAPGPVRHPLASAAATDDSVPAAAPPVLDQAGAHDGARTQWVSGLPALRGLLQRALADSPPLPGHPATARVQPAPLAVMPSLAPAAAQWPAAVQHLLPAVAAVPVVAPSPTFAASVAPQVRPLLEALGEDVLVDRLMDRLEERLREQALRQFGRSGGLG